jgi:hypothetical protein
MAEPAQRRAKSERVFLFSSESANEGHLDKFCDTCLRSHQKKRKVAYQKRKDVWQHAVERQYEALFGASVHDDSE